MGSAYTGEKRRRLHGQHQIDAVRSGLMHTRNPRFYNVDREDQGLYYGDKAHPMNQRITGCEVNYTPSNPNPKWDNGDGSRTSVYNTPRAVLRRKRDGTYIDHRIFVHGRWAAPNELPSWW